MYDGLRQVLIFAKYQGYKRINRKGKTNQKFFLGRLGEAIKPNFFPAKMYYSYYFLSFISFVHIIAW